MPKKIWYEWLVNGENFGLNGGMEACLACGL